MSKAADLVDRIARSEPIAAKLRRIAAGEHVVFGGVTEAAFSVVAATITRAARQRTWIVCENVRAQEGLHNELQNWVPDALLFPEMPETAGEAVLPDPESIAERLDILQRLAANRKALTLVVTKGSLDSSVPNAAALTKTTRTVSRGAVLERDAFAGELDAAGYDRVAQVTSRGQYAVRGGIVDVYSWQSPMPLRIELFGDTVESIRQFDLDAQTSVQHLDTCSLLLGVGEESEVPLREYLDERDLTVNVAAGWEEARVTISDSEDEDEGFTDHGLGGFDAGDLIVEEAKRARLFNQLREWHAGRWQVCIVCNNEGEMERFRDLLAAEHEDDAHYVFYLGSLANGFLFPAGKVAVLSDSELFGRYRNTRARRLTLRRAREQASRSQIDFSELNEGDYVVHLEHGIGRFAGLQNLGSDGENANEVLVLEFENEARLYVPLEQSFLVSRYVGVGKKNPQLSSLGDARWAKAKKAAEGAVYDYAAKLLAMHAERETSEGFSFGPDTKWQQELERSFLFKETADQLTAITDTKNDMESERPMDRLICGDVGFGKTEVAIRAAFKAVMNGKQVAVLVPTTVLAQQHYHTFRERMSDYPVTVEMLSRFRTATEQKKVVAQLREGGVDIVIGTHRLISKDVQFKDLGLVVIDEEQRFGVLHKEKFKSLFKLVDLLTLSATPIPRTLYLSLMGAKDMSIIETPPLNRIPVETTICPYDERIIRDAIRRELSRQGQVYFLHNRIGTIEKVRNRIVELCPGARVEIGHGQMEEGALEEIMQRFVAGETDVLVSTTIIESGLDIPNANTIIIDRADRFGLADLYQLRGRVGRAQHKAYAYLMLPRDMIDAGEARKRINAIKQYSSLGAGFKIAMRDLEIRGAGNILGTAQSGHIIAIGFELYCQLLKQAVARLKGEKVRPRVEVPVRLDFVSTSERDFCKEGAERVPAFIPTTYIEQPKLRIQAYRALAESTTKEQLDALQKGWRDRFGAPPTAVNNLLVLSELRLMAATRTIAAVEVKDGKLMLRRGGDFVLIGGKFPRLTSTSPELALREVLALLRNF